jgi:cob(I)alamin adenosyltransferase
MPRITRVYTRTGDDGTTGLGGGQRVPKESTRVTAYGTVDELNSQLGVVLAGKPTYEVAEMLLAVQNELFHMGSDLCVLQEDRERMPVPQVEERHVVALEAAIDRLSAEVGPLENFVLPGGAPSAAHLHVARTVCRRAERWVAALAGEEAIGEWSLRYLNRLSDLLFVMARFENLRAGVDEPLWDSRA